jgi:hypothetical protein
VEGQKLCKSLLDKIVESHKFFYLFIGSVIFMFFEMPIN